MLSRYLALFTGSTEKAAAAEDAQARHHVAAAALLVEAAGMDADYGAQERGVIERVIRERFGLSDTDAAEILAAGEAAQSEAVQLLGFTRAIKEALTPQERVSIIEMLWEVAYADGTLHDYEAHLVSRVAGLIYVSDVDRGAAKRRVLDRLGLSDR